MRSREIERRLKKAAKLPGKLTNNFYLRVTKALEELSDEELFAVVNSGEKTGNSMEAHVRRDAEWMLSIRHKVSVYGRDPWNPNGVAYRKRPIRERGGQ